MDTPKTIGKYEVLERIGKGGLGVVYKGRDPRNQRPVAIKVCTSADETLLHRFLREAEVAGDLHHRNIATVYELGHDVIGPFLVQEYLEGETLEAKLRRADPVPRPVRLGYLLQIARALEYAHTKGTLHRDVKPSNVWVLDDERVKLLGFGIAKLAGAETQLTRTGRIPGTAGYLAPEQIRGEPVDARSDVFSFGVLAYELLTRIHPFPGTTLSELLHQVVRTEPDPVTSLWPGCPPGLAALVAACLDKDPDRRPESFSRVREALSPAVVEVQEAPEAPRRQAGEEPAPPSPDATSRLRPPPPLPEPVPAPDQAQDARPADLEATQAIRPVAAEPAGGGTGRWSWRSVPRETRRLALVLLVLVVLGPLVVAGLWTGLGRWLQAVRAPEATPEAVAPSGADPEAAPVEGLLVVDAVPWAEVVGVTGPEDRTVPLFAERSTPLALSVPVGSYTVELTRPDAAQPATCRAEVTGSGIARCTVRFPTLEPLEYFNEAGWWD
ncbi:MAG: protein kinase domain-containing protein [Thermoanaerobaculia bacterium]